MHTLWMREHNRIARQLVFHNPVWLDDRIYEEARRIVIAEYQHIIFNEWLPLIVGSELMEKFGLFPLTSGHSKLYLDTFDPRVSNEFATAAFRFGHSLIPTSFRKISGSTKRNSRSASLNMKDIFFKPQIFMTNKSKPFLDDETSSLDPGIVVVVVVNIAFFVVLPSFQLFCRLFRVPLGFV